MSESIEISPEREEINKALRLLWKYYPNVFNYQGFMEKIKKDKTPDDEIKEQLRIFLIEKEKNLKKHDNSNADDMYMLEIFFQQLQSHTLDQVFSSLLSKLRKKEDLWDKAKQQTSETKSWFTKTLSKKK